MTDQRVVLSGKALGITETEHAAMLEVRELFASGKLYHDKGCELMKPNGFNMNVCVDQDGCGTTCCIGGWMYLVMVRDGAAPCKSAHEYVALKRSRALAPLFFPFTDHNRRDLVDENGQSYDFPYEEMPPAFGLAAMDNFLATGDPNWPAVTGH